MERLYRHVFMNGLRLDPPSEPDPPPKPGYMASLRTPDMFDTTERTNDGAELPADVELEPGEEDLFDLIGILEAIDGGEYDDALGRIIEIVARS